MIIEGLATKESSEALSSMLVREKKWWDRILIKPQAKPNHNELNLPDVVWKGIMLWANRHRERGDSEGPLELYLPRLAWTRVAGGVLIRTHRRQPVTRKARTIQYAIIGVDKAARLDQEKTLWVDVES